MAKLKIPFDTAWGSFNMEMPKVDRILGDQIVLEQDFVYIDPNGVEWHCEAGFVCDGASIPRMLWPFMGHPLDDENIRFAIPHDRYCSVDKWDAHHPGSVHKMLYNAARCSGDPHWEAIMKYQAVRRFGPKWKKP